MGYVTDSRGRLCCDACGNAGNARRHRCPVGYCAPAILCPDCYRRERTSGAWDKAHRDCPAHHAAFIARERAESDARAAGRFVWCSGLSAGPGVVHAIFRNRAGATVGRLVPEHVYDAAMAERHGPRTLNPCAWTLEDFNAAAGYDLPELPGTFAHTGTATKGA